MLKHSFKTALFLLALFAGAGANAQTWLEKLQKFAGSPDEMIQKDNKGNFFVEGTGTVYMADGTTKDGTIRFELPNETCIQFREGSSPKSKEICSKKINHFTIGTKQFWAVEFKESSISIGHDKIFMEMLNDKPEDKFHLFFLRRQLKNDAPQFNEGPYKIDHDYFVTLPGWEKAYDVNDFKFTPFAKKMSEQLKDCPELSKKIADKEEGYKVNMFNGAANNPVYYRIMQEYNNCGK